MSANNKSNGGETLAAIMYALGAICLIGAVFAFVTTQASAMMYSGFAAGVAFFAFASLLQRVARTQVLVEWMAREMQILREQSAARTRDQ